MILGFSDKSRRGGMGRAIRAFSHVKKGVILLIWCVYLPRCVIISIHIEYRAVITMLVPIKIMIKFDHEKIDITTNSSPIRVIVGGRAKFVGLASCHQVAISGRRVCRPQAKIIVWLWTRSQFEFARQNNIDEAVGDY